MNINPRSFSKMIASTVFFELNRDTWAWYTLAHTRSKFGKGWTKEKVWRSCYDTFHWNMMIFAGEMKANFVLLVIILAEWVSVASGVLPVHFLTTGPFSKK